MLKSIDKLMWNVILKLQESKAGRAFVKLLYLIGIERIWNFFMYVKDSRHPTGEMLAAREFFSANESRIREIRAMLCEEESREIFDQCIRFRQTHKFRDRPGYTRNDQYFPAGIIELGNEEVFVDCGAYNGDTVEKFCKVTRNRYKKIIAFEPDEKNIKSLKRLPGNIIVEPAAAWCCKTVLQFDSGRGSSSSVIDGQVRGGVNIRADAIDNIAACEGATYIKMDIEGAEYEALLGAVKTIQRYRPKLAVCIYHSDEDMLRIIELIHSWNLGYRLYVRHHAQKISETVLYAVVRD